MQMRLDAKTIDAIEPPASGRIEVSDTLRPGLRLRITSAGKRVWVFEKRIKGGPKRKVTLGTYPALTLAAARKHANEIDVEAQQGIDRVEVAKEARIAKEAAKAALVPVREVLEAYDALHLSKLASGAERLRQLRQSLEAQLDEPIQSLSTRTLQSIVDGHMLRGKLTMANRIRAALAAFTAWAAQRGHMDADPGLRVARPSREKPRERCPSITEVRAIYAACDDMGPIWGPAFKLLILTGQRRAEILNLSWEEVELDAWRIVKPGSETKNGKAHITHLSEPAAEILLGLLAGREDAKGFVFTTTGKTPVSGVSKAKARLDELLGNDFEPWRIHDLRTSMATALADAGESEQIVDRILNHSASGSAPSAVARVYQRSDLLAQRAVALDKWAALVTEKPADVVTLHGTTP